MAVRRPVYLNAGAFTEIADGDVIASPLLGSSDALASGDETLPRGLVTSNTGPSTSGTLRLTYFTARRTQTTTQIRTLTGGTAAAATPTLCRVGLYSIDGSDDATLVASTTNDTALWAAASTAYTRSWASSYATVAGQRYALGLLVVTAATAPTWVASAALAGGMTAEAGQLPRVGGSLTAQTDLPSSFANASVTSGSLQRYYGVLLP